MHLLDGKLRVTDGDGKLVDIDVADAGADAVPPSYPPARPATAERLHPSILLAGGISQSPRRATPSSQGRGRDPSSFETLVKSFGSKP